MKSILFAGGEVLPFAATGGLGDVLGSLPEAIKKADPEIDVRVVMPGYSAIAGKWRSEMKFVCSMTVNFSWRREGCGVYSLEKGGVTYYFIVSDHYFARSKLYGEFDDGERFAFFSYAVLELMSAVDFFPDILHANDWQTAIAAIALKGKYGASEKYRRVKAIYTIHNIDYQGIYDMAIFGDVFGFGPNVRNAVEFEWSINLTKGAVICADYVTTVSPRYAMEIQYEPTARGLSYILREHSYKIDGIINGIDESLYDPKKDKEIPSTFSMSNLSGKAVDKAELQRRFGLAVRPDVPVIAMISRLAEHKGFDLVMCVGREIMQNDVQIVLLGTGEKKYEDYFRALARDFPGRVGVSISYDRALSKLIYAGADMFLMPSKSEACGLAQMIASRYGTVPIVHEVGGLYDTIKPYTGKGGNGFTFAAYNAHDMLYVIRQAESVYRRPSEWTALEKRIMKIDFSWDSSAKKYIALYNDLLA